MSRQFDIIIVGAGPAGNTAAYLLGRAGFKVLQIERGEYPGSKNVQGAILYAEPVEAVLPEFRKKAPLSRHIIEQRLWIMDDRAYVGGQYRDDAFNEERPNRYTIIRAEFDKWFSKQVQGAGVTLICETTVTELLKEGERVVGVRTDRENGDIHADAVILADGVNSLLAERAGLRPRVKPDNVALAVKEVHFMPTDVINERFNVTGTEGVVIEMMGKITRGMVGTGFLYTNRDSLSIGVGCMVADFQKNGVTPYQLLDDLKNHPAVKPLLKGGEPKEYAAHLIPEGGYNALPRLHGEGWVICGDSGGFVNAVHREGSNLAMTSGRLAAETLIELREAGRSFDAKGLKLYRKKLDNSVIMKDLKKYRDVPDILHRNRQFLTTYPELLNAAANSLLRVDGTDKLTKERQITRSFVQARRRLGLMGDIVRLVRAFR